MGPGAVVKVGGFAILLAGLGLPILLSEIAAGAEPPVSDFPPVPGAAGHEVVSILNIEAPMQVGQPQHAPASILRA